jgi:hypothetical protein
MDFPAFDRFAALGPVPADAQRRVEAEEQSSDYESGVALIGGERWRIRTARITSTKPGAFVAVWQRGEDGTTRPFGADDETSGLLVFVHEPEQFGVFRFTTAQLISLGIVRSAMHPGKRGFRLYPPWCTGLNPQASLTQRMQSAAFRDLSPAQSIPTH